MQSATAYEVTGVCRRTGRTKMIWQSYDMEKAQKVCDEANNRAERLPVSWYYEVRDVLVSFDDEGRQAND